MKTEQDEKGKKKEALDLSFAWKCGACFAILGYTDASREVLRIKYKDLYVYINGGEVTEICRGCGKANTVTYDVKKT